MNVHCTWFLSSGNINSKFEDNRTWCLEHVRIFFFFFHLGVSSLLWSTVCLQYMLGYKVFLFNSWIPNVNYYKHDYLFRNTWEKNLVFWNLWNWYHETLKLCHIPKISRSVPWPYYHINYYTFQVYNIVTKLTWTLNDFYCFFIITHFRLFYCLYWESIHTLQKIQGVNRFSNLRTVLF